MIRLLPMIPSLLVGREKLDFNNPIMSTFPPPYFIFFMCVKKCVSVYVCVCVRVCMFVCIIK